MKTAAGLALLLFLMPPAAYAGTRVELGAASVVFPSGIPRKIVQTPEARAKIEAMRRAQSPAAADRMSKIDAEIGPIDGWAVMDSAHGVSFLFSVHSEGSMPANLRQANQSTCPSRMPTCRDVRIGDALGKEFDRLGPDGLKTAQLTVSKGGRRYIVSYIQSGRTALARLNATPARDDPRVFLGSFRLNGAAPVWP